MSFEEPKPGYYEQLLSRPYAIYLLGSAILCVIVVAVIFAARKPATSERQMAVAATDTLASGRSALAKTTDLATCRNAIQQINLYLTEHSKQRPPALTSEHRAFLSETCLADPGEMAEVEGGAYTLLDAYHLAECYLFRDAAQSLQVNGLPPAEQAEAAFRWTIRQVRLRDPFQPDSEPVPPDFVARRGWGTALERGFVFLALLRQIGVEGCIIATPTADGTPLSWGCGALVEPLQTEAAGKKEVLLFDPRLGIPLPGPKGEGIATLAGLREHPELLKALTVNPESPYDVAPEQVAGVEILLVEPLSALSPRMAVLQKDLLGPSIKGRLAADPNESLNRFAEAAKPLNVPVRVGTRWTGLSRRFLPPDEGGSDRVFNFPLRSLPGFLGRSADNLGVQMTRKRLYELQLAAWPYFPEKARELPWSSELGQRPRGIFGQMFISFYLEPRQPRDLVIRGRYDEAVGALNLIRDKYDADKKRLAEAMSAGLDNQFNDWKNHAFDAYAALARANQKGPAADGQEVMSVADAKRQVEAIWKDGARPLSILIEGGAAKPLDAESTYLVALAWHEQAVHLQQRVDRDRQGGRAENPADVAAAQSAWQTTLSWWRTLSGDTSASHQSAVARRWYAEAYLAIGDRATARALLEDLTGDLTPLEKTARLYLASRIKP